jgi:hypothetical protein
MKAVGGKQMEDGLYIRMKEHSFNERKASVTAPPAASFRFLVGFKEYPCSLQLRRGNRLSYHRINRPSHWQDLEQQT